MPRHLDRGARWTARGPHGLERSIDDGPHLTAVRPLIAVVERRRAVRAGVRRRARRPAGLVRVRRARRPELPGDPFAYLTHTEDLASGRGYATFFFGDPSAYYPPGYPGLLGALLWTARLAHDSITPFGVAIFVNLAAGVATVAVDARRRAPPDRRATSSRRRLRRRLVAGTRPVLGDRSPRVGLHRARRLLIALLLARLGVGAPRCRRPSWRCSAPSWARQSSCGR